MTAPAEDDRADAVARAIAGVPTVRLHHGSVVGTHMPGRRIAGIRLQDGGVEVHVSALWPTPALEAADAVRAALAPLALGRVDVVVSDITFPDDPDQSPEGSPTEEAP